MRVLFCPAHYWYDDFREGSELSWAYNIADRVATRFPNSVVVTGKSVVRGKPYRIMELTPHETRVNFGPLHAFAFNVRYTVATFRVLHRGSFDIVHHVLPFALGKTYNLAALRRGHATPFVIGPVQAPLVVLDRDVDARDFKGYSGSPPTYTASLRRSIAAQVVPFASNVMAPAAFSRLFQKTMAHAAAVVAVNRDAKELLLRSRVAPSRVVVIPPGVDADRFRPDPERSALDGVELLSVCQLIKRKNVDVIIRAFARVASAAPNTTLRIVGDGPQREALRRLAAVLGVGGKVTFAGAVPNARVHDEYQRADVFVNASADEGFATTSLEAAAAGLPVVSTRVGGFSTVVEHGRSGYIVEAVDPDALAASLLRLIEQPRLVEEFSSRARARAEHEFDWETAVIPQYLTLYDRVIQDSGKATTDR